MRELCYLTLTFVLWAASLCVPAAATASLESVLLRLAQRSRESKSDAVLVLHNGRVIFEYRSDPYWQPIEAMAMTKSMTALAIGLMLDDRIISSVDEPVYHFYPEWDQGNKRLITIRHLLSHTSGLQADLDTDEIYHAGDIIQLALCAELSTQPGTHFYYNNKAVNLLSGIVKKATGRSLSEYLTVRLFAPLGIDNVSWLSDNDGTDYAMAHMIITAPDLAKIGQMLANGGNWCARRILSKEWVDFISSPGQTCDPFSGHLWWLDYYNIQCYWDDPLLNRYLSCGISPDFVSRLRSLQGRIIDINGRTTTPRGSNILSPDLINLLGGPDRAETFYLQVRSRQLPMAHWKVGSLKSFSARGYLGQQLIVMPYKNMVGVRQIRARGKGEDEVDPFHDFGAFVEELAYRIVEP